MFGEKVVRMTRNAMLNVPDNAATLYDAWRRAAVPGAGNRVRATVGPSEGASGGDDRRAAEGRARDRRGLCHQGRVRPSFESRRRSVRCRSCNPFAGAVPVSADGNPLASGI